MVSQHPWQMQPNKDYARRVRKPRCSRRPQRDSLSPFDVQFSSIFSLCFSSGVAHMPAVVSPLPAASTSTSSTTVLRSSSALELILRVYRIIRVNVASCLCLNSCCATDILGFTMIRAKVLRRLVYFTGHSKKDSRST